MASGGRGRGSPSRLRSALTAGDRPFILILVALVVLAAAMALGPLQVFTAAADRVDQLEEERDRLREDVEGLEERKRRLEDPEEVERLARSELGMVRPGEIPFVLITPEEESDHGAADGEDDGDGDAPWYRRLGRWLGDRVAGDE